MTMIRMEAIPELKGVPGLLGGIVSFSYGLGKGIGVSDWYMAIPYGVVSMMAGTSLYLGLRFSCEGYAFGEHLSYVEDSDSKVRAWLYALVGIPFFAMTGSLMMFLPG